MKRFESVCAAAVVVAGCAASNPPASAPVAAPVASPPASKPVAPATAAHAPIALRNAGFEEGIPPDGRCPAGWSCTMHADPDSFRFVVEEASAAEGRRHLCIERVTNEPWALATQSVAPGPVRGKRLRLSMALKVEGLPGAGAGPWMLVQGRPRAHANRLVKATQGWQRVALELDVPAAADVIEVGATLEGAGRACLDDVRIEVIGAPSAGGGR
jgi:hypothetical protein